MNSYRFRISLFRNSKIVSFVSNPFTISMPRISRMLCHPNRSIILINIFFCNINVCGVSPITVRYNNSPLMLASQNIFLMFDIFFCFHLLLILFYCHKFSIFVILLQNKKLFLSSETFPCFKRSELILLRLKFKIIHFIDSKSP